MQWLGRSYVRSCESFYLSSDSNPFFGNGAGYAVPGTAVPYPGISYPFDMIPLTCKGLNSRVRSPLTVTTHDF